MALDADEYLRKLNIPIDCVTLRECQNALLVFEKYDGDCSDTLTKVEMENMLLDSGKSDPKTAQRTAEGYLKELDIPIDDVTIAECKSALAVFEVYDGDKSDTLTTKEMEKLLTDHGKGDNSTVKKYFEYCDLDEDGEVTREEFLKATVGITMSDCWRRVFNEFDKDKNGFIDENELAQVFKSMEMSSTNIDVIRDFIKCHDLDSDGRINYEEFLKIIVKCSSGKIAI